MYLFIVLHRPKVSTVEPLYYGQHGDGIKLLFWRGGRYAEVLV